MIQLLINHMNKIKTVVTKTFEHMRIHGSWGMNLVGSWELGVRSEDNETSSHNLVESGERFRLFCIFFDFPRRLNFRYNKILFSILCVATMFFLNINPCLAAANTGKISSNYFYSLGALFMLGGVVLILFIKKRRSLQNEKKKHRLGHTHGRIGRRERH